MLLSWSNIAFKILKKKHFSEPYSWTASVDGLFLLDARGPFTNMNCF